MKRFLIIFAKEPNENAVKTRLKDCLSGSQRINLYKAFVKDTLAVVVKVRNVRKILAFSSQKAPRFLKSVSNGFEMIEQRGRTLGDRMHNAFACAYENMSKMTVIIGTDSPTLPSTLIEKVFKALNHKDVVIGPSADGGYYLIGMKEPCADIFKGVRWSSDSVLKKTLANAKSLGKTTALLEEWYDVDDREGLNRLTAHFKTLKNTNIASNTRRFLKGGQ